jgi:hypothetical protein
VASKKLEKAIVAGKVEVKNIITGEVKLEVNGQEICLAYNQIIDLTKLVKSPKDVANIPGLRENIRAGRLLLL